MSTSIFISAGEASGEQYGAMLLAALHRHSPEPLKAFGLGGEQMRAAGAELVVDARDVAVVGLVEVLRHLPEIRSRFQKLLAEVDKRNPALALLIDFPDFNLRLARELHQRNIPVVYFVSPQLWAWRQSRINQVRKYVRKMLVIFPFEVEFYAQHGVEAEYVGHPLADLPPPAVDRSGYAAQHGLSTAKQWIALLPGSRKQEIERNLPEMMNAAAQLGDAYEFVVPIASTIDREWLASRVAPYPVKACLVAGAQSALAHARAAVVASGTATVEAALVGIPFVVVYRVAPITYMLGKRMVQLPNFAMPNLIAGKTIVPELIQHDFTPARVLEELNKIIPDGPARAQMQSELVAVREKLRPGVAAAADRAAMAALRVMTAKPK
jgi:lipid-A-disaccharide synthase